MTRRDMAHRREDDMVGWLPEEAEPMTLRELVGAFGPAIPTVFLGLVLAILGLIMLGSSPPGHPGWF